MHQQIPCGILVKMHILFVSFGASMKNLQMKQTIGTKVQKCIVQENKHAQNRKQSAYSNSLDFSTPFSYIICI